MAKSVLSIVGACCFHLMPHSQSHEGKRGKKSTEINPSILRKHEIVNTSHGFLQSEKNVPSGSTDAY